MNDKFKPWIDSRRYLKLSEALPLGAPLSLLIDPSNICNFQCIFCPTGHSGSLVSVRRPKGMMDHELFRKIINDIRAFPNKLKGCYLYKDGEPFLNKNLGKMIAYAKLADITESLETTTNGSLLTLDRSIEIIEAGLDRIRISVEHVENEGYRQTTRTFGSYDTIRKNIESVFLEKEKRNSRLHVHAKLLDTGLEDEEKEKFLADFGDITDSLYIDSMMLNWPGSGNVDFSLGKAVNPRSGTGKLVCPEPFKTLSVNFNGIVSVCCMDWKMETAVGDCRSESLTEHLERRSAQAVSTEASQRRKATNSNLRRLSVC